jgi:hypothetical protein
VLAAVGIALGATFDPSDAASRTNVAARSTTQATKQAGGTDLTTTTTKAPVKSPAATTPATKKGNPAGQVTPSTTPAPRPDTPRPDTPRHDHPSHDTPSHDTPPVTLPPHDGDPSACFNDYGEFLPATHAEFRRTITRAWLLCDGLSFLGTVEAGIELRPDGRWSKLDWVDGDTLVRASGAGQEGDWESLDIGPQNGRPTYQLTFHIDEVGTVVSVPVFGQGAIASAPSMVRINNLPGTLVSDYVPVPPGITILPAPEDDQCDIPADGSYSPPSEAEFRDAMTGAWLLCGAPSLFGTAEAGLELRPDGRWSKLQWTADGSLVRAAGPENEGSWVTVDVSEMNGRALFSIQLTLDGGGWISMIPVFAGDDTSVSKVHMDNMGNAADYVPTDGPVEGG